MIVDNNLWHVLIVEASSHGRAEVRAALLSGSSRRYDFSEAGTGAEGIEICRSHSHPTCLVLNSQLPDMTALEVLRNLPREGDTPAFAVVVLTDSGGRETHREVLRAGAQGYVGKEWMGPDSLTRIVESAVERHAMTMELRRTTVALAQRESSLVGIFQAMAEGVVRLDADGRIVECNPAAEEILGLPAARIAGRKAADFAWVREDGAPLPAADDPFRIALGGGTGRKILLGVRQPDDELRCLLVSTVPLPDGTGGALATFSDITDRRSADLALRASEELNRSLMDGSADCVKVLDPAGQLLHMNAPGLCQMEIDDFRPFYGKEWASLWPAGARVRQAVDEARAGEVSSFEAFCPTAKGTPRWWEVTVSPVRETADGEIVRLLAVSRDVTSRRFANEALRESEHRLRLALEGAEMGMWDWDMATDAVSWSPECYVIHGLSEGNFDGTADGFGRLIYPADAESVWTRVRAAIAEHRTYDAEFRIVRPSGEIRWVVNKGRALYDSAGQPIRMIGIIADVTERKRAEQAVRDSEERMRMAQAVARIGTFAGDPESGLLWTPEMEALHGLAPGTFGGAFEDWLSLIHPADRDVCIALVERAKETGTYEGQWRIVRPDGTVRWVAGRASVRRMMPEDPAVLVGVNIDITAEKEIAAEREQLLAAEQAARIEIERVAQSKDEFLATLSHELRTPLSAIIGWTQILERAGTSNEKLLRQGLEVIARNANSQSQLIGDLLDMNRIVTGKLKLTVGPLSPNQVGTAAADTIRPAAEARRVNLEVRLEEDLPQVNGDAGRLQQVLWNLLTNAIKFTPAGGTVALTTALAGGMVRFVVEDTGQGIDPAFLPRLFDRFSQADASAARKHGGLGLGLSIARQLVELHGGTICAESEGPGRGARFTVSLPIGAAAVPPSPPASTLAAGAGNRREVSAWPDDLSLREISVLVVDDQLDTLEATSRILTEFGAEVTTAPSAEAALALLRRQPPHILLADIGMPEVDGYHLIRKVREGLGLGPEDLPAIAVTAFARTEDRDRALAAGYQAHIAKPVRPESLVPAIANLARRGPALTESLPTR